MSGVIAATSSPTVSSRRHWGSDVLWATILNLAQAGGPFLALAILARSHGLQAAGEFAYAQAVTAPVAQLLNLQLKALMLTHSYAELPLSLAMTIRASTSLFGVLFAAAFAAILSPVCSLWMMVRVSDSWAEVCQAEAQRSGRMAMAAASASARAILLLLCVWLTGSLLEAANCYLILSFLILFSIDRFSLSCFACSDSNLLMPILKRGSLLGVVLFLQAASSSIPRIVLERKTDLETLGLFATLSVLIQTGNLAASAFGQGLLPSLPNASLSRIASWVAMPAFVGLIAWGFEGMLAPELFLWLHVNDSPTSRQLLDAIGLAQILIWPSAVIGYCLTSRRLYRELIWVGIALVCSSAAASFWLVPQWGVVGAVGALAIPALVNLVLGFSLLPRGIRR